MLKLLALVATLIAGCSFGPGTLQSRHSSDLEARNIRRIAVLPPAKLPPGTALEPRTGEREVPERLARSVYSAMAVLPGWQIHTESEVREVEQSLGSVPDTARLRRIGKMVHADAVVVGRVLRYRERIGDEWGAKSPASVAFVLDLVDVRRGDVIWSARFDETQKALSENIFAIGSIGERGIRWLTADQLMDDGVKKAVGQLHQIIARKPTA
jgi:hypothetical protein